MNDGAFTLLVFEVNAHGFEDGEEVSEEDGGINAEGFLGGDGDFAGELGSFAEFHEGDAAANFHVFREVSAGLSHDPQRRGINGLSANGFHEAAGSE
jgi:hypothetical protein